MAPGGRLLPNLARRGGGELGLSVEITLWLAKLTAFVAPPMLALLGDVHRVHLDDVRIIVALVGIQLVPYVAGRELRRRRSSIAERLRHPLDLVRGGLVVAVLARRDRAGQDRRAALRRRGRLGGGRSSSRPSAWRSAGSPAARSPTVRRTFALAATSRDLALALTLATLAYPGLPVELPVFAVWHRSPSASASVQRAGRATPSRRRGGARVKKKPAGEPVSVLVVDDSDDILAVTVMALEGAGYRVFSAQRRRRAFELVRARAADGAAHRHHARRDQRARPHHARAQRPGGAAAGDHRHVRLQRRRRRGAAPRGRALPAQAVRARRSPRCRHRRHRRPPGEHAHTAPRRRRGRAAIARRRSPRRARRSTRLAPQHRRTCGVSAGRCSGCRATSASATPSWPCCEDGRLRAVAASEPARR